MQRDTCGYPLSTESEKAAEAFEKAVSSYIAWRTDTMDHIKSATEADPGFALPYAFKGILIMGLRKPELRDAAQQQLAAAKRARKPDTEREQRYIAGLEAAIDGRIAEAVTTMRRLPTAIP